MLQGISFEHIWFGFEKCGMFKAFNTSTYFFSGKNMKTQILVFMDEAIFVRKNMFFTY